jgi:hypothetical protein
LQIDARRNWKISQSAINNLKLQSFVIPARHRPPEAGSGEAGGFVSFVVKNYPFSAQFPSGNLLEAIHGQCKLFFIIKRSCQPGHVI